MNSESEVLSLITNARLIHQDRAQTEVSWFYNQLGINSFYFKSVPSETIAEHITTLYGAKMINQATGSELALNLQQEKPTGATYIVPSMPGQIVGNPSEQIEYRIEQEYLREGYIPPKTKLGENSAFRVQVYRTSGTISENSTVKLRMFFVQKSEFQKENVSPDDPINLENIADRNFYATVTDHSKDALTEVLKAAQQQLGPVFRVVEENDDPNEIRILVAYRRGSTHSLFSGLTALYHYHGLRSSRKYIETFSNGFCTYSLFLVRSADCRHPDSVSLNNIAKQIIDDLSLIYVLPRTSLFDLFKLERLSAAQVTYAYTLWKFAHQFFGTIDEEFTHISRQVSTQTLKLITKVRAGLKREVMTEARVSEVIFQYTAIIQELYEDFKAKFYSESPYVDSTDEILAKIKRVASTDIDIKILSCMVQFNRHLLKTNFFKGSKVALSFRLDAGFLKNTDYPVVPYAITFIVGAEFRGFHVRFADVARGGIRIIRSLNDAAFAINVATLFEENYNLALTQQRKNKDIPESGAKGTILLSKDHSDKPFLAYKKYIDALLDLVLIPDPAVRDFYGKPELLFLGPDEGTADFSDWASLHAKERGYPFWKSFTTGKSKKLGGIPHDEFGMTTGSIHEFVLGILRKKSIDESSIRKFQTGGPDGDLGSNEIKISRDRTIGIVDGSGVLYDPVGIDRAELTRLANLRKMVENFDFSKLSPQGFFVSISDTDKILPNGRKVESGLIFRNSFHLYGEYLFGTELFVPCGGRPAAVNANNIQLLYDDVNKAPMFKYIVEGANLFFTQEARIQLEDWGVILFKDASANKGGVTSSSLEVLSALALTDAEYSENMQVHGETPPSFYADYVREVKRIISEYARDEFECLWREHQQSGTRLCELTDILSEKINSLTEKIFSSSLWDNPTLREKVIVSAVPKNLVELIGVQAILNRVPDNYLRAIFSTRLACRFVYTHGINAGEFGFFEFMQGIMQ